MQRTMNIHMLLRVWLIFAILFMQETASQIPICLGGLVLYQCLHFTDRNFNLHITGLLHLSFPDAFLAYVSHHSMHHSHYSDSLSLSLSLFTIQLLDCKPTKAHNSSESQ